MWLKKKKKNVCQPRYRQIHIPCLRHSVYSKNYVACCNYLSSAPLVPSSNDMVETESDSWKNAGVTSLVHHKECIDFPC